MSRRPPPSTPSPGPPETVAHVLLVDDDPGVLGTYGRWLRRAGYQVTTAPDLEAAIRALTGGDVDVVITDMHLAGGSGLDLLDAVRADWPELPVLFVTGSTEVQLAVQALERGALRYLMKPLDPPALCQAVDSARRVLAAGSTASSRRDLANLDVRFDAALTGLTLAVQPIVRWPARTIVAYEALVRTREASLRRPDRLIAAGETLGRVHDLGRVVRREAAALAAALPAGVALHVNVHPMELTDDDLFDPRAPLSRVAPRVVLELTERTALDRLGDVAERIATLRRLGYRIALDDLGAGYASLAAAALLRPETLKLDGSLVRGVARDPVKKLLVRAVHEVCRDLRVGLVCEGVEDVADLEALAAVGCDRFQGNLFARPGTGAPEVIWPPGPPVIANGAPAPLAAPRRGLARGSDSPVLPRTKELGGVEAIAAMLAREARSRLDGIAAAAGRIGAEAAPERDALARGIADHVEEIAGTLAALIEIFERGQAGAED